MCSMALPGTQADPAGAQAREFGACACNSTVRPGVCVKRGMATMAMCFDRNSGPTRRAVLAVLV
jgi:hypothetical protein